MHKLLAGVTILEQELSALRLLVERQTGILLDCPNSALAGHIADYLERHDLESPAALLARLRSVELDAGEMAGFLDGIMNVSTGFFRHPGAMTALGRQVLPQILARKVNEGPSTLRIWSAGCGSGEEPYSIAMAVCEALGSSNGNGAGNGTGSSASKNAKTAVRSGGICESSAVPTTNGFSKEWAIHIVGTDLLRSAIQSAERGVYPQSALTGLPPATIRACFSKIGPNASDGTQDGNGNGTSGAGANGNGGAYLLVKPRLRSLVTF
ncbi:MAG: CheR family methyltransferase, partial [Candidatus Angelobacter sp.]